jgi:hypothetical protein
LQQVKLITKHVATHHTQTAEGIVDMDVGVLDTGVSRSTCSRAYSTAQLRPKGETTTKAIGEDPHEEAPHEENDDQNCYGPEDLFTIFRW